MAPSASALAFLLLLPHHTVRQPTYAPSPGDQYHAICVCQLPESRAKLTAVYCNNHAACHHNEGTLWRRAHQGGHVTVELEPKGSPSGW